MKNVHNVSKGMLAFIKLHSSADVPARFCYEDPGIQKVILCTMGDDGRYVDIRTGNFYEREENTLVWPVFFGSVFCYPDGKMYLYTFSRSGQKIYGEIQENEFSQLTMAKYHLSA